MCTGEGWLYVASVIDVASRAVVGWSMGATMETSLVNDALTMAAGRLELPPAALFHSDRGAQYTSTSFAAVCAAAGVGQSMGRVGSCYDNAVAESFWATLKREVGRAWWPSRVQARADIFVYIETWTNTRRLHSSIGYRTPNEVLTNTYRQPLVA